jgi:hypothetical protein
VYRVAKEVEGGREEGRVVEKDGSGRVPRATGDAAQSSRSNFYLQIFRAKIFRSFSLPPSHTHHTHTPHTRARHSDLSLRILSSSRSKKNILREDAQVVVGAPDVQAGGVGGEGHAVALQVAFERQILKPVFSLDRL